MTVLARRSESPDGSITVRRRDRRQALGDVLLAVTRAIDRREDLWTMRAAFEDALSRALPVRTAQLRDPSSRWSARGALAPGAESIALDVPGSEPAGPGVLEATFDPGSALADWELQMLGLATHVGGLVLEIERLRAQLARLGLLTAGRQRRDGAAPLIGSTPAMHALRRTIERVSATDFTVLLEGESGVGKELVARQIHELGHRKTGPFVAVNCAALVETLVEAELFGIEDRVATGVRARRGKFEAADGGTLFLDEVSDLSPTAQAKLLRAIQDFAVERVGGTAPHRVDIRIVAASNRGLARLVEQRLFRPDLFYRLSGVDIRVPCLRERRSDIGELAHYFLARHRSTRPLKFSPEAMDALVCYDWPGNVRELERLIERVVALAATDVIELEDLPPLIGGAHLSVLGPSLKRGDTLRAWARRYARLTLEQRGGNKRDTARVLGISYHTLQAYLRAGATDTAVSR
ncbi:MAG TPA: sigma-54 dependent transcriptional regulator [Vicinamibacterales bacterium]|nr:sigma-54 dependent transcriptional regulator [Vicinamibacterales bacterium]